MKLSETEAKFKSETKAFLKKWSLAEKSLRDKLKPPKEKQQLTASVASVSQDKQLK